MNERKALSGAEWGGIGLFVAGAFGTVLMVASMLWPDALAAGGGTASIAAALGVALGALPTLFLSVCVGWLGARLFLRGPRGNLVRDLLGAIGVAFGVSIVLSAVSSELGGRIGSRIGNLAEGALGTALHVATGVAVIFVTLRLAWGGSRAPSTTFAGVAQPQTAPRAPSSTPISAENTPRTPAPLRTSAPSAQDLNSPYPEDVRRRGEIPAGAKPLEPLDERRAEPIEREPVEELARAAAPAVVSLERARANLAAAPAAALVEPALVGVEDDGEDEELNAARVVESDALDAEETAVAQAVEPLVPAASWEQPDLFEEEPVDAYGTPITLVEDVRRERAGEEPVVARPTAIVPAEIGEHVDEDDDLGPVRPLAVSGAPALAPARDAVAAAEDELDALEALVAEQELDAAADGEADLDELADEELEEELDEVFAQDEAAALADEDDDALLEDELELPVRERIAPSTELADAAPAAPSVVAAAWESLEVEVEPAEQRALVDEDARALPAGSIDARATTSGVSDVVDDASQAGTSLETTRSSLVEALRKARIEAASDDADVDGELAVVSIDAAPAAGPADTTTESSAKVEARSEAADSVAADSDLGVAARLAAIGARAGEHEAPSGTHHDALEMPSEAIVIGSAQALGAVVGSEVAAASASEAPANGKGSRKRSQAKDKDKEAKDAKEKDDVRAKPVVAPSLFDGVEPATESSATEADVVLTPLAPTPPERAMKTAASLDGRKKLLADAGCLFLERGRVAVSMLQREPYGLDFDDACKVLDEMQEMGLIGPYLGGQRRDFLMNRDQWLERLATV